jgi:hypothetical protein
MFGEPGGALRSDWGIEQTIYTPWRLPPDRPYAGWLEVFGTLRTEPEFGLRRMTLHVGVAGPPSYGEQTQRWIHRQFGFGAPPDWTFQYPAELGVTLEGEGAWSTVNLGEPDRFGLRAGPRVRIRIGNMNDDARAGIAGAIGWDPTPPWSQGHAAKKLAIYLTGAVHADLIARDSFLEGPFFNDGDAVQDVRRIVGEAQTGIAVQFRQARFEYRIMRRSKEYEAQPTPHTYSSLMFTWTGNR